jgi:hypothetical protein
MTESDEDQCCDILFSHCGDGYNFNAWFWLVYRGILYKFLGLYPPPKNPYSSKETYLCTNIADPIAEIMIKYGIDLYPIAISFDYLLVCWRIYLAVIKLDQFYCHL